jgi:uncharacterized membrane protein YeaQ/YmgE (transglycosylase-associated protein family)
MDAQSLVIVLAVGAIAGWVLSLSQRTGASGFIVGSIGALGGILISTALDVTLPFGDPLLVQATVAVVGAGFSTIGALLLQS